MKRSSIKPHAKVSSNSKFSFEKFHHNRNFYRWISVPSIFGYPLQFKCFLGSYVVRYRGTSTCVW